MMEVFSRFGLDESYELYSMNKVVANSFERDLRNDSFFLSLSAKEQKVLLSGRRAYYWRGRKPKPKFIDESTESALYKLLSNHVHSFPLGANVRYGSGGLAGETYAAFYSIETLVVYSASAIQEFCSFRWKLGDQLTEEEWSYIKNIQSEKAMDQWLDITRQNQPKYS